MCCALQLAVGVRAALRASGMDMAVGVRGLDEEGRLDARSSRSIDVHVGTSGKTTQWHVMNPLCKTVRMQFVVVGQGGVIPVWQVCDQVTAPPCHSTLE